MTVETKASLKEETIEKLQELITVNIDSSEGFAEAAEKIDHENITGLFRRLSRERQAQARELQGYVAYNREEPEDDGSVAASLHRGWIDLRAAINRGDPHVILIEAERGEDHIKEKYEDVLKDTPGTAMNDVLLRQYRDVKRQHDLVRELRDTFKDA